MVSDLQNKQHVINLGEKILDEIELRNSFKEKFNIFQTLGIETKEVDLHSRFLYELWNPKGSHGQGTIYLEIFIKQLLSEKNKKSTFNIDLSQAIVKREHLIKGNRRIDFVFKNIKIDDILHDFLFEMKIDAGDQENQLKDYNFYGENRLDKFILYYLTLYGSDATKYSTGKEEFKYERISFQDNILKFIEKSIEKTSLKPNLREILEQYRKTILNISGGVEEEDKKIMKEFLLKDDNLKIIDELSKAIPEAKAEIEMKFWNELTTELGDKTSNFIREEGYHEYTSEETEEKCIGLDYNYNICNKKCLTLTIARDKTWKDLYYSISIWDENDKLVSNEKIITELKELMSERVGNIRKNSSFLCWDTNINFKYSTNDFYKLDDKDEKKKIIKKLKDGFLEIAKFIHKNKNKINKIIDEI